EPLGPTSPVTTPRLIVSETPGSTSFPPRMTSRPSIAIAGVMRPYPVGDPTAGAIRRRHWASGLGYRSAPEQGHTRSGRLVFPVREATTKGAPDEDLCGGRHGRPRHTARPDAGRARARGDRHGARSARRRGG